MSELWIPDPLDGAGLLDELDAAFTMYVVFPLPEAADAVALYAAATHGQPAWQHAARLVIKSPLKRCGKSRLEDVIAELCHRPLLTANISTAALVRSIDAADPPTIILDKTDAVFSKRRGERSEKAEDLRGIINAGHSRGRPYVRWDAATRRREECPTFAMVIVAGIGDMPDTVEDRAVITKLRRRAPGEYVARFRLRRSVPPLHDLRGRVHEWVRDHLDELAEAEPTMPDSIEDRAQDTWEPLVAIADLAGADWPARARKACQVLTGSVGDPDDGTASERLLDDLHDIFEGHTALRTEDVLAALHRIAEAPWARWAAKNGDPLNAYGLAKLLKPYGIRPGLLVIGDTRPRGYKREDFTDAWSRYLKRYVRYSATEDPKTPGQAQVADAKNNPLLEPLPGADLDLRTQSSGVADVADTPPEPAHCTACAGCAAELTAEQAAVSVLCPLCLDRAREATP